MSTTLSVSKSKHVSSSLIVKRKSQVNNVSVSKCFTLPAPALRNTYWMQRCFFHKQKLCSRPHAIFIFFIFGVDNMNFIVLIFGWVITLWFFPLDDCSFIYLFMRLIDVMENPNRLTDHTWVISKVYQLSHSSLCPPTPCATVVHFHPAPTSHTNPLDWWRVQWIIQGVSFSILVGFRCAHQLQPCL